jgi:3-hydroxyisobutyrate dehydrogenase-like beta-hydroxyacid dehydrogenase
MIPEHEVKRSALHVAVIGTGPMSAALAPNAVRAQIGTIGIEATEHLAGEVRVRRPDVALVDAQVSGSRGHAESEELPVLASGSDAGHLATTKLSKIQSGDHRADFAVDWAL